MTAAGDDSLEASAGGYRDLLRLPVPRRLALMALPADFSDWLDYAAVVAILVFAFGEGPFILAAFSIVVTLPYVLVGPLLAVLVDRSSLRVVLFWTNLARGLTTFGLIFAGSTPAILALVFLRAAVDSAFTPSRQAAIQASTPVPLLNVANGVHHAINQTSKIAGPAVGGLLLAVMPADGVFAANGVLSLIAAALALTIPIGRQHPAASHPGSFRRRLTAGIAEFGRSRLLRLALIFSATAYFAFFLYDSLIALLVDQFELGATAFGLAVSASGAGGLVGALVAGRLVRIRPLTLMAFSALVGGVATIVVGVAGLFDWSMALIVFLAILGFMGGSTAFMTVPYRTIIQSETPPERIARVYAAGEAVMTMALLLAPFAGSAIASAFGTGAAFVVGGAVLVVLAALTFARRRRYEPGRS